MHEPQRQGRLLPQRHGIPWPLLAGGGITAGMLLTAMLAAPATAPLLAGCATSVGAVAAVLALLSRIRLHRPAGDWSVHTASETTTTHTVRRGGQQVTAFTRTRVETAVSMASRLY